MEFLPTRWYRTSVPSWPPDTSGAVWSSNPPIHKCIRRLIITVEDVTGGEAPYGALRWEAHAQTGAESGGIKEGGKFLHFRMPMPGVTGYDYLSFDLDDEWGKVLSATAAHCIQLDVAATTGGTERWTITVIGGGVKPP